MAPEQLRRKGAGFIARARATADPAERRKLLRAAAVTLTQARQGTAAEYAARVGRAQVSLPGYREYLRGQLAA